MSLSKTCPPHKILNPKTNRCVLKSGTLGWKIMHTSPSPLPVLKPIRFTGENKAGDFAWMIRQPKYKRYFFIFNDNEEQFLSHSKLAGGGNAAIRPYQHAKPPRAAGIPTGKSGRGYQRLTQHTKQIIDRSLRKIKQLADGESFDCVVYSANEKGGLGSSIFAPSESVKNYIVSELKKMFPST